MKKEERREDILRAATGVFVSKGYRPTSIDDLVEAAGISKGLFYVYFDSKQQAFIELVESYFEGLGGVLEENHRILEGAFDEGADAVHILATWRANALRVLRYNADNLDLARLVYQEALGSDEDFAARVSELSEHADRLYFQEFKTMADRGSIRPGVDIEMVAALNTGGALYLIMRVLLRKKGVDLEALADQLLDYHARALAPPGFDIDGALRQVTGKGRAAKPRPKRTSRAASGTR
jgi:AcrR family transcriptional regulator